MQRPCDFRMRAQCLSPLVACAIDHRILFQAGTSAQCPMILGTQISAFVPTTRFWSVVGELSFYIHHSVFELNDFALVPCRSRMCLMKRKLLPTLSWWSAYPIIMSTLKSHFLLSITKMAQAANKRSTKTTR